jgi:CheY-like chemotaxis protein
MATAAFPASLHDPRGMTPKATRCAGISRALLVGDDVQVLADIEHAIAGLFYVATSTSGEAALRMLEHDHFDVVVYDQCMSGMNGVEFLALAEDFAPECARIMLADNPIEAQDDEALTAARVSALLTRQYDAETLIAVLTAAVAGRSF